MTSRLQSVAKGLAALLLASAAAAQTSLLPMFVLDGAAEDPFFLGASIIEAHTLTTAHSSQGVMTMSVDCLPGHDACRARSSYPAEVWHTQGSVFGGTVTARAGDSITAYACDLGTCGRPECGPECVLDITAGGLTRKDTITLDACGLQQRSALLSVTAGADKLPLWYYPTDSSELVSAWSHGLGSCARTTATVASTTATPSTTPAPSMTRGGASQSQASDTSAPASTTMSRNGSARGFAAQVWLQSVAAAGLCIVASCL